MEKEKEIKMIQGHEADLEDINNFVDNFLMPVKTEKEMKISSFEDFVQSSIRSYEDIVQKLKGKEYLHGK